MKATILIATLMLIGGCSTLGWLGTLSDGGTLIEITRDKKSVRDDVEKLIMKHEGFVNKPYDDKGGIAIGYGSNLSRRGLSRDEAYYLMHNDVVHIEEALPGISPASETISHGRYAVLVSMAYNLGLDGLSQFHRFLAALEAQNYELAAQEMERSLWCVQVGKRCEELASIMRRGYI